MMDDPRARGFDPVHGLEDLRAWCGRVAPGFEWTASPEQLSGGLMNEVWRLHASPHDLVFKWAPPYVASAPEIALSSARLMIEARALQYVREQALYAAVFAPTAHEAWEFTVPQVRGVDAERAAMLMDFIEGASSFEACAHDDAQAMLALCQGWGGVIGRLHAETSHPTRQAKLTAHLRNMTVQRTRAQVHYQAVRGWLVSWADARDASQRDRTELAELGMQIEQLGQQFVALPGACLVMGDLWPRSLLVQPERTRVTLIDWEFAHFGQPAQDVGHALAHMWMMGHQRDEVVRYRGYARAWLDSYTQAIMARGAGALLAPAHQRRSVLHHVAEILARTLGPFITHEQYLFESPKRDEAITHAVSMWKMMCSSSSSHPHDCLLMGMW